MPRGRTGLQHGSTTAQLHRATIHQRGIKTEEIILLDLLSSSSRKAQKTDIYEVVLNASSALSCTSDERRALSPVLVVGSAYSTVKILGDPKHTTPVTAGRVRDLDTNVSQPSGRPVETMVSRMQLSCAMSIPDSIMWNGDLGN